jgi:succinate dehydrogenase/fumarate reductase flavoprotein subunit
MRAGCTPGSDIRRFVVTSSGTQADRGSWLPQQWDAEADVVVLGYGGAGATFGAVAAAGGSDVLILEKGEHGGGNSVCLAGSLILHADDQQRSLEYLDWLCGGQTQREVLEAFVEGLDAIPQFQSQLGFPMREDPTPFRADGFYPEYPGAPGAGGLLGNSVIKAPGGAALWTAISQLAEANGVRVEYNLRGRNLIQDPVSGEVLGVRAERADGNTIAVKGRRATVLATGGYEFNPEMLSQFLTHCPVLFVGSPNLTGDGVYMAQRAGAKLWHMNSAAGPLYWGIKVDGQRVYCTFDFMRLAQFGYSAPAFKDAGSLIWVNKYGNRFYNETIEMGARRHGYLDRNTWLQTDPDVPEFTNVPAFQIFDEKVRAAGPAMTSLNSRTPPWSADNLDELEKGWVIQADSIEELAHKCAFEASSGSWRGGTIDATTLVDTAERWNDLCAKGVDDDFGREDFLVPLDIPPYYAIGPMLPTFVNTHGGPKHDARQRVLDAEDRPIPRLYAIGECGSMWGPYYNSMGDISEFIVGGSIAARHALRESNWD